MSVSTGALSCAYVKALLLSPFPPCIIHLHTSGNTPRLAVFEYIDGFYNRRRRHSALGRIAPEQFYLAHQTSLAQAQARSQASMAPVGDVCNSAKRAGCQRRSPKGRAATFDSTHTLCYHHSPMGVVDALMDGFLRTAQRPRSAFHRHLVSLVSCPLSLCYHML